MEDTNKKKKKTTKSTKKSKNKNNYDPKWKAKKEGTSSKTVTKKAPKKETKNSEVAEKKVEAPRKVFKKIPDEEIEILDFEEDKKVEKKVPQKEDKTKKDEAVKDKETKEKLKKQVKDAIDKLEEEEKIIKVKRKERQAARSEAKKEKSKAVETKKELKEETKEENTEVKEAKKEEKIVKEEVKENKVEPKEENKNTKVEPVFDLPSKNELDQIYNDVKIETLPTKEEIAIGKRKYYNYLSRVCTLVLLILLFLVLCLVFAFKSIDYELGGSTTYSEYTSNNYSVCTTNMEEFGDNCLGKDLNYITNVVENINITFNYEAVYSKKVLINNNYRVVATLKLFDKENADKIRYTREDVLVDPTNFEIEGEVINFVVDSHVDFVEYSNFVKKYDEATGVQSGATLEVALYLDEEDVSRKISYINIPLTEESFGIESNNLDNQNQLVIFNKSKKQIDPVYVFMAVISLLMDILLFTYLVNFIYMVKHLDTKYNIRLKEILKNYDSIIVNARNDYKISEDSKIIKVESFEELLDARNTLEKPIVYEKINNIKSKFYVEDGNTIYIYTMKDDGK